MPAAPPTPLLAARDLTVALSGRPIVAGASFSLARGERVALMAPSGAGKTTLLRAVLGLIDVAAGQVLYDGAPVAPADHPAFRRAVVWVAQRPPMFPGTVRRNLEAPFAYRSAGGAAADLARAAELLVDLGLHAETLDDDAERLSEGQKRRVALVRALLLAPRALLLDEPASGLDEGSAARVEALLVAESDQRGLACAVVTHDAALASRLCHRTVDLTPWLRGTAR